MDHTIAISGASQVTATGGDRSAGIGGSFGAAVRAIDISLATIQDPEVPSNHGFTNFVKATGGKGAAGIGSGAATEGLYSPAPKACRLPFQVDTYTPRVVGAEPVLREQAPASAWAPHVRVSRIATGSTDSR